MTVDAFDNLSEDQKLKMLMKAGSVMSERRDSGIRCYLYYLDSFYVIVKYDLQTDNLLGMDAFIEFDRKERTEWRILRVLPALQQASKGKIDGLLELLN